eukprot:SAG31_NODE_2382_length_5827_cov_1.421962_2_plen_103_part_00
MGWKRPTRRWLCFRVVAAYIRAALVTLEHSKSNVKLQETPVLAPLEAVVTGKDYSRVTVRVVTTMLCVCRRVGRALYMKGPHSRGYFVGLYCAVFCLNGTGD